MTQLEQALNRRAYRAGWKAGITACSPQMDLYMTRESEAAKAARRYVKRAVICKGLTERQAALLTRAYGAAFLDSLETGLEDLGMHPGCRLGWI